MDVEVGAVDLAVAEAVVEDSVAEVVAVAVRTDEVVVDSTGIALTEP